MGITTDLAHHFLEAVDQAAIASAAWRGKGDKNAADDAAVEAMRRTFDAVPFDGRVAIGEGERDDAPMLYIGEELGSMVDKPAAPQIDIAVDPARMHQQLRRQPTQLHRGVGSRARGTLLHAPDCYMDKLAVDRRLPTTFPSMVAPPTTLNKPCMRLIVRLAMYASLPLIANGTTNSSKKSDNGRTASSSR